VRVRITDTFSDEVESPLRLTVASALPKGDRQRFLIEKLTELGVARFIAMTNRFYVDRSVSRWDSGEALLAGDEAHHFSKVMRGRVGDSLVLFDGSGTYAHGIAESIQKESVRVRITDTFSDEVESPLRLTVASALPKGDRQRFLIEKLTELGVARFVPVVMERSVARANESAIQRLRRYVIESAKQCGRNVLMEITDEVPIHQLNDLFAAETFTKFLLHPVALGSVGQTTPRQILAGMLPEKVAILAGPEGSFTDQEVEAMLRVGFQPLDLGKRILRSETACIAAAALLLTFAG
jgi:16S rRNA (uracil1498-N3)-methyltransferase